jgi:hypothetical protein
MKYNLKITVPVHARLRDHVCYNGTIANEQAIKVTDGHYRILFTTGSILMVPIDTILYLTSEDD